jgi:sigma-B regulation protein RsbU (phosphoserine phosphatase)
MAMPRRTPVRFRERAELLEFLLEVSRVTSETLEFDRLLENVASIVKQVMPYDLFAIFLHSERAGGLRIRYSIGHREEVVRSLVIPLQEGIVGAAAAARASVVVEDVRKDPRYLPALDAVRSEMAAPMLARGKLVGVIDVQSTQPKTYGDQERMLLSLIASRVAASVDNASLYRRVERQNRTMRTLAHLSQEFSSILDLDELLGKIAAATRALFHYHAFSVFLLDAEKRVLRHRFSVRYDQRVNLDNIPCGKGITGAAAESREPVRVLDTGADERYIPAHPGIRSELAVPLIVHDRVVGVLDVESEQPAYFTEEHQRTLALLAPQIASSIENARLYEELALREQRMDQDLKAARKLQRVLLPREPRIPGLEIAVRSRPAREISGDVYDFIETGDGALLAFGDVSGKGAAAALYGALIAGLLRTLAPRRQAPSTLLRSLNQALLERKVEAQYATLAVASWHRDNHKLLLSNAGAGLPLIWRSGEILKPRAEGVPIGLLENRDYEQVECPALPGDILLFCSDGVEDQVNPAGQDYGRARVAKALKLHGAREPRAILEALFADLEAFQDDTPITDDQTVAVIQVRP